MSIFTFENFMIFIGLIVIFSLLSFYHFKNDEKMKRKYKNYPLKVILLNFIFPTILLSLLWTLVAVEPGISKFNKEIEVCEKNKDEGYVLIENKCYKPVSKEGYVNWNAEFKNKEY